MSKMRKCICGGTPIIKRVGDNKLLYIVKCAKCGLILAKSYEASNLETGAIRLWNRRIENA